MKNLTRLLFVFLLSVNYGLAQNPSIASYDTHVLCADGYSPQMAISNIVFDSPIGDSIYLTTVSYPTIAFITDVFYNETAASHVLLETLSGGQTGVFSVDISYSDGSSSYTETIQVKVAEPPVIIVVDSSVCNSSIEFDLNPLANLKGGSYEIQPGEFIAENGILDVQKFILDNPSETTLTYRYDYVDEYGCSYSSDERYVDLLASPEISLNNVVNTSCNDNLGAIETSVYSPNGSYTGYWNNGVMNMDGITSLTAGDYYYTVEDNTGCKDELSAIVETDGFLISGTVTDVNCKNGSDGKIDMNISGGSGNYRVIWSSGQSAASLTGLSAGTYIVKVTDMDNGCETYKSFEVEEPLEKFRAYFIYDSPTSCSANDGKIYDMGHDNGTPPFTYLWGGGETTNELTGLGSGTYNVIVTDAKGCKSEYENNISYYATTNLSVNIKNTTCGQDDGEIILTEIYPYAGETITEYSWSNGSNLRNIKGLSAGNYTLTFTQSDGCIKKQTFKIKNKSYNFIPEICIVTVDTTTNTNLVVWEKEFGNPNKVDFYKIYRANSITNEYDLIDTVRYSSMSVFNDVIASPERRSWEYKISAVNTCGQGSRLSQHHKTIHLVMNEGAVPEEKILTWDHYEGLEYFTYSLYRGTDIDGWQLIDDNIAITSNPNYIDIMPTGATEVDYIIEVIPSIGGGCSADFGKAQDYNSSRSNKPSPIFNPGVGTGDPNNSLMIFENNEFKATLYPNPSNGNFNIEITDNVNNQKLNMTVMGINGRVIHQQDLKNELNSVQLNIGSGMYFVQIQGDKSFENIRVIVQ